MEKIYDYLKGPFNGEVPYGWLAMVLGIVVLPFRLVWWLSGFATDSSLYLFLSSGVLLEKFADWSFDRTGYYWIRLLGLLARRGNGWAIRALIKMQSDSDAFVRKATREALMSSGNKEAIRLLKIFDEFKLRLEQTEAPSNCSDRAAPLAWKLAAKDEKRFKTNLEIIENALMQLREWLKTHQLLYSLRSCPCEGLLDTGLKYVMGQGFSLENASRFIELFVSNIVVRKAKFPTKWEYISSEDAGDVDHIGYNPSEWEYWYVLDMTCTLEKTKAMFGTIH